eukprot:9961731-Alexandrium_andersonii.AAC.1
MCIRDSERRPRPVAILGSVSCQPVPLTSALGRAGARGTSAGLAIAIGPCGRWELGVRSCLSGACLARVGVPSARTSTTGA